VSRPRRPCRRPTGPRSPASWPRSWATPAGRPSSRRWTSARVGGCGSTHPFLDHPDNPPRASRPAATFHSCYLRGCSDPSYRSTRGSAEELTIAAVASCYLANRNPMVEAFKPQQDAVSLWTCSHTTRLSEQAPAGRRLHEREGITGSTPRNVVSGFSQSCGLASLSPVAAIQQQPQAEAYAGAAQRRTPPKQHPDARWVVVDGFHNRSRAGMSAWAGGGQDGGQASARLWRSRFSPGQPRSRRPIRRCRPPLGCLG